MRFSDIQVGNVFLINKEALIRIRPVKEILDNGEENIFNAVVLVGENTGETIFVRRGKSVIMANIEID